jgi:hypothetical protein
MTAKILPTGIQEALAAAWGSLQQTLGAWGASLIDNEYPVGIAERAVSG